MAKHRYGHVKPVFTKDVRKQIDVVVHESFPIEGSFEETRERMLEIEAKYDHLHNFEYDTYIDDDGGISTSIIAFREETEEEYIARWFRYTEELTIWEINEKKYQAEDAAEEKALYEKLKEKYERKEE